MNVSDKGLVLRQGIVIAEIERCPVFESLYKFTYDPDFYKAYQIEDMEIRDEPHFITALPFIMYSHMLGLDKDLLMQLRYKYKAGDDFALWLACCDEGYIREEDGCRWH